MALLETKLHVPRRRRGLISRPRLDERLSRGAESTLTVLSAPAGFGKTTVLADWLAATAAQRPVAWVSLDRRDNDPAVFWSYVVAALNKAIGVGASLLQAPQPAIDTVLASLLNDLDAVAGEVVLVLDDYHLIESREVQDGMGFLLENLPAQVHLVIASRADPAVPLARLRARGELVEIRAADLRFTPDEAAAYLNEVMGLVLTPAQIAALEARTEGWIAALQLAALSMQGRDDVAAFIAGFAGDDRYIVDYLAEEVLQRQPEHVQQFLLQTAILDRLSGALCDAVTGQDDGKATLTALERANLFLVPLDDRRQWYRYHQLFADVLRAHLHDEQPEMLATLHRRASDWYDQNGEQAEAIRHALAGEDFAHAADLIELAVPVMSRTRQERALHGWLKLLPDDVVRVRPVLIVGYAGTLLLLGQLDDIEDRLRAAERWLAAPSARMVVADDEAFRHLPGLIELYRAALALAAGQLPEAIAHAQCALELSPESNHLERAAAAGLMGLAFWASGNLESGHRAYSECVAGLKRAGHVVDVFGCAIALADIRLAQGRPGEAMRTYEQTLQFGAEHGGSALRGTADMYVGMSEIYRERNDLPAATQQLLRSQELGEYAGMPQNRHRWRVAMARVREAEGDLGAALELLNDAERVYVSDFFPEVRPISAMKARVHLAKGMLDEACDWVRARGVSVDDELSYLREFEHITLARVLLANDPSAADTIRLLERLVAAAEEGQRTRSVVEILVLQAVAHRARDNTPAALAALHRAVTLAEPDRYIRLFADERTSIAALLKALADQDVASDYIGLLLAAMDETEGSLLVAQRLIEPLSARELDVLRLLGTDLDGPDIARRLFVSLNTMRTHTKNIYAKLGVNNRRAAVRRAAELDLLSRTRDR
ncbi:MAG TPA: LuxR C-terminal-related transcriptional regulator [Jatrophihabitantaceae bacterium]|jgi:LuxR family maltose regulon positive regulatory protein|nr:LuxR C-terminal-related transcriptional regulator [Jatrophihabitantaceae bacterium]